MTIAVTPFDGLCGFRPLGEITYFLKTVKPLRSLIGEKAAKDFQQVVEDKNSQANSAGSKPLKDALQAIFTALMTSDRSEVKSKAQELVAVAKDEGDQFAGGGGPANTGRELADLVVRLNGQFEGDIGLFVLFFLNYVKLQVGEAMFLKADDIHAYLSGGELPELYKFHAFSSQGRARYH